MTDHTPAPDPRDQDPVVAAAADRLRQDAGQVDTMAAMHRVTGDAGGAAWLRPSILVGGLAVAVLAVIGVIALITNDDGETVVADGDRDQPAAANELDGTAWTFVSGGGISPPEGWPITLSFDADTFGGTASCNGYGGGFSLGDGGAITLSEIGSTAMACEPAATMEAEAAFLTALFAVDSFAVSGDTLNLFGQTVELIFERQAPLPTAELVGQLWLLDTLIQGETASSVAGDPATLLLRPDGTLEGGTGCRTLTGTWVDTGSQIVFTSFAAEGNSCTPDLRDQDGFVVTVLGDGFVPSIENNRLTVTSAGEEGLSYQAVEREPEPAPRETLAEQLAGTGWSLLEGQGPTGPIISSSRITLQFLDGGIAGGAPCNSYSATTVFEGDQIEIVDLVSTEIACEDLDAESEFFAALLSISSVAVEGAGSNDPTLVMAGGDSEMIFERTGVDPGPDPEPGPPPFPSDSEFLAALVGTPWQLVDTATLGIATSGVTLEFSTEGTFGGEAHCNSYGGTFGLRADVLTFGPVEAQEEGCERSDDEAAYFAALGDVDIALLDADGNLVLNVGLDELIFVPVGGSFEPEPAPSEYSVSELLDLRPDGPVTVISGPITYGTTTILCDAEDLNPDDPTRCPGRWVVVTNYIEQVDGRGPFTGVLDDDGRFQIVGPGSGVEQRGSGVDLTQEDDLLLEPLLWLTGGVPVEEALEGFRSHLAPTVDRWLGPQLLFPPLPREDAGAPASWVLDDGGLGFEGYAGPFSVVDTLVNAGEVEIIVGPHDHCAGQPRQYSDTLQGLRQLSIQPTGIDSCIAWFSIDVFVNEAGEIEAVMLDLFGP
ncbi:MAG: META domain-containing protein [Actinomycetota bacterium]